MRTATGRKQFEECVLVRTSSHSNHTVFLLSLHLIINKHTTWCSNTGICRSDKEKKRGPCKKMCSKKGALFHPSLLPKLFPRRWSTSLNLMQNVRWVFFVKNREISIFCLTESSYLSAEMYQQCCSVEQMEVIPVATVCLCHSLSGSHKPGEWRC